MTEPIRISNIPPVLQKLIVLNWGLVFLLIMLAGVGLALYSAAGGNLDPWASKQMLRFGVGLAGMIAIALVDIRQWYRWAYWIYAVGFASLVVVEIFGHIGMGAQRCGSIFRVYSNSALGVHEDCHHHGIGQIFSRGDAGRNAFITVSLTGWGDDGGADRAGIITTQSRHVGHDGRRWRGDAFFGGSAAFMVRGRRGRLWRLCR